ncbi:MAG: hypothetical protein A2048_08920 [Deltaproteobacteria bacterium GWA2_45_12]|nr:MAG: hypothetical protein A2048_08920 [Deltaproteobacteria bacterium GWA2_45_12]
MKKYADKTSNYWDNVFVDALRFPVIFFLISLAVALLPVLFKLSNQAEKFTVFSSKFFTVLGFALFVQKLLLFVLQLFLVKKDSLRTYTGITRVGISGLIYTFFILIFLDTAGISITPFIASLGVGSLAIALALQETLASFFAGFYLVADKPIRVGDYVRLESGEEGHVQSIGWRSVRLQQLSNSTIIIPNSKFASSIMTNYYFPKRELAVLVNVRVDYSSDLEKVETITTEVARDIMKAVPGGLPDFEPFIRYGAFGEAGIEFTVILRGREFVDQYLIRHEFIKKLHKRYEEEGIVIPSVLRMVPRNPRQ